MHALEMHAGEHSAQWTRSGIIRLVRRKRQEADSLVIEVDEDDLLAIGGAINWALSPWPISEQKRLFLDAFEDLVGISKDDAAALLDYVQQSRQSGAREVKIYPAEAVAASNALTSSLAGDVAIFEGDIHTLTGVHDSDFARVTADAHRIASEVPAASVANSPRRSAVVVSDNPVKRFFDGLEYLDRLARAACGGRSRGRC